MDTSTKRLCSEIQLFDLCDLDSCTCKEGRFCTNPAILARFEAIKEEDDRPQYLADELDEDQELEEDADDPDAYGDDDYEDDEQ